MEKTKRNQFQAVSNLQTPAIVDSSWRAQTRHLYHCTTEDAERDHHDHLIDLSSGEVIEFVDAEIEALQDKIARKLGYELRGHRLELYGVPLKTSGKAE